MATTATTATTAPRRTTRDALTEQAFLNDLARHADANARDDWETTRGIYCDWLGDNDRHDEADYIRAHLPYCPGNTRNAWPTPAALAGLSPHQQEQAAACMYGSIGILTGSPGTGKTRVLAAVVAWLADRFGSYNVAVCAPTGKAAVRCRQAISDHYTVNGLRDPGIRPLTIHQTLGVQRNGHDGNGWNFRYCADDPLRPRFVICDEFSMASTQLAAALVAACNPKRTRLLLVGDPGQLPPVGHGAPLRDLIRAGVPHGHLTEIRRNAGMIVEACAAIRNGQPFAVASHYDRDTKRNLVHYSASAAGSVDVLRELIARMQASKSFDPMVDLQVITAVNESGEVSRVRLNAIMQDILNPLGNGAQEASKEWPRQFRPGDKIICLSNGLYASADSDVIDPAYIANGEIGWISSIERQVITAVFDGRAVRLAGGETLDNFDLAYAITCHKSQGSQAPLVVVMVDNSRAGLRLCGKEWVYTAISRAQDCCITVGNLDALQMMARRDSIVNRQTWLTERVLHGA